MGMAQGTWAVNPLANKEYSRFGQRQDTFTTT